MGNELRSLLVVLSVLLLPDAAISEHLYKEKAYQNAWCARMGGETEVVLDDGARVDCLTSTHAVEFDFGPKWAESVGQALYYSLKTGKQPGIVLILEKNGDKRYLRRLQALQKKHDLTVWTMGPESVSRHRGTL